MNKSTILLIIIAIVIGTAAAVALTMQRNNENTTIETTQEEAGPLGVQQQTALGNGNASEAEHVITYTDDGYEPAQITISVGETVEFINQSSANVWTASDPHPQHTDLPEFDALRGQGSGESYSFTFTDPGEWGYHNHVRSFHTGVVIVQ